MGESVLYPADRTKSPIPVATTPSDKRRGFLNWKAQIRRAGGVLP